MKLLQPCNQNARSGLPVNSNPGLVATLALLLLLAMSCIQPVLALSADAEAPIEIEADFFELDDKKGITIYSGNVVVYQGSLQMNGDKLTVRYDDNQELEEVLLDGKLARFKQQADGSGEWTHGQAVRMEYYPKKDMLYLITTAKVTQGDKSFSGDRIEYDIANSRVRAKSATTTSGKEATDGSKSTGGRVRIVIPPKKKN